jgi:murein DD-endopeptidase MepM/ murein hydrolase activator NlpD
VITRFQRQSGPPVREGVSAPLESGRSRGWVLRLSVLAVVAALMLLLSSDYSGSGALSISGGFVINSERIEGEGVRISLRPPRDGEPLRARIEFQRATIYGLRLSNVSRPPELGGGQLAVNQTAPGPVYMDDLAIEATGFSFTISGGCLRLGERPLDLRLDDARVEARSLSALRADFPQRSASPALAVAAEREPVARSGRMIRLDNIGDPGNLPALIEIVNSSLAELVTGGAEICGDVPGEVSASGAAGSIPGNYLRAYEEAAEEYGLDWAVLAAIGFVESGHGGGQEYTCVQGPPTVYGRAVGPMQFLPSTWRIYGVDANGDGVRDPCHYRDAIFGAANYLVRSGAPEDYHRALYAYNNSHEYVQRVLELAEAYRNGEPIPYVAESGGYCPAPVVGADHRASPEVEVTGNRSAVFPLPARYMDSYTNDWGAPRPNGGHEGTDIFAPEGTPVYSITDGIVRPVSGHESGWWNYLGGWVAMIEVTAGVGPIRRGDVFYYAHLVDRPPLEFGQRVRAGDLIGYVGHTGYSSVPGTLGPFDPHLHLGWYVNDTRAEAPSGAKNPYPLLEWLRQNGGRVTGGEPYIPSPAVCERERPAPSVTVAQTGTAPPAFSGSRGPQAASDGAPASPEPARSVRREPGAPSGGARAERAAPAPPAERSGGVRTGRMPDHGRSAAPAVNASVGVKERPGGAPPSAPKDQATRSQPVAGGSENRLHGPPSQQHRPEGGGTVRRSAPEQQPAHQQPVHKTGGSPGRPEPSSSSGGGGQAGQKPPPQQESPPAQEQPSSGAEEDTGGGDSGRCASLDLRLLRAGVCVGGG